jgi:hypothetical protein
MPPQAPRHPMTTGTEIRFCGRIEAKGPAGGDEQRRHDLLNNPNPAVAHAAGCVGNEGTCAAATVAPLEAGFTG